jgi:FixJ family two-component response regulator
MSNATPIVFVVDDESSICTSLSLLIESAGLQCETFASGPEFLMRLPEPGPGCLVLDVQLPDLNGLDVQRLLAARFDMPVIFISGHGDVPTTVRAMKAGALEFLTKPLQGEALLGAIADAIERSRDEIGRATTMQRLRDSYTTLSRREQEVMRLVVRGRLNKQVAGDLGISEITVKAHRGKMMRKMNARTLADLVLMAVRLCLIPLGSERAGTRFLT